MAATHVTHFVIVIIATGFDQAIIAKICLNTSINQELPKEESVLVVRRSEIIWGKIFSAGKEGASLYVQKLRNI